MIPTILKCKKMLITIYVVVITVLYDFSLT